MKNPVVALVAISLFSFSAIGAQAQEKELTDETLHSCIKSFAEARTCDSRNWKKIHFSCNLDSVEKLRDSKVFLDGLENNGCTIENWNRFSSEIWEEIYSSRETFSD